MTTPWSNQRVDLIILQEAVTGFSGLFGYSPTIGTGNLIFSLAAVAGTDPYGNAYPAGLSITGAASTISGSDYTINNAGIFIYSGTPTAGNLIGSWAGASGVDAFGNAFPQGLQIAGGGELLVGNLIMNTSGIFIYNTVVTPTVVTKTSGSGTIPIPSGVTTVKAECWGGGGGGGGAETTSGATGGGTGGNSTLTGTSVTVTANGGGGGGAGNSSMGAGGTAGSGSTNTTHNSGGAGAAALTLGSGGGGGSGGTGAPGNAGTVSTGGAAVAGGGPGGNGTTGASGNGSAPASGPGGGGGGGAHYSGPGTWIATAGGGGGGEYALEPALAVTHAAGVAYSVGAAGSAGTAATGQPGGAGFAGQVRVTYTVSSAPLVASITPTSGTDGFGNNYPAGITTYDPSTGRYLEHTAYQLILGSQNASSTVVLSANLAATDVTTATAAPTVTLTGPTSDATVGEAVFQMGGSSQDGTTALPYCRWSVGPSPDVIQFTYSASGTELQIGILTNVAVVIVGSLTVNGPATLDNVSKPSTPTSAVTLYGSSGHLKTVSSDGVAYDTERLTAAGSTGQVISSTGFTPLTGVTASVGIGTYWFDILIEMTALNSAGAWTIELLGPTTSTLNYGFKFTSGAGVTGLNANETSFSTSLGGPATMVSGAYWIEIHGYMVTTATGALSVSGKTSAGADTWSVFASIVNVIPVV